MRFFFTRHGESYANTARVISNRDDAYGLTPLGVQQAETLADRFVTENIVRLYSSPLLRAQETSRILAEKLGVPVIIEDALRENDCGALEGRGDETAWADFIEIFQAWMQGKNRDIKIGGGESFDDITHRFTPFINNLVHETHGQNGSLLLVSHGGVLYTMLPLLFENISHEYAVARIISNTSIIIAD